MSDKVIFADGLEALEFDRGIVKVSFFSNRTDPSSGKEQDSEPEKAPVHSGMLAMHLDEFLELHRAFESMLTEMEEKKLIVKEKETDASGDDPKPVFN